MRWLILLFGVLFLLGCSQPDSTVNAVVEDPTVQVVAVLDQPTATPTLTVPPSATATLSPSPTAIRTAIPSPTATKTPEPKITPSPTHLVTPSPTPNLYLGLTINELTAREYGGGELEVLEVIDEFETWTRYLIRYPSEGLDVYGFLNVPNEGWDFPVALVLHGFVAPEDWKTVSYTRRYADALVEAGYMVIHPSYRNHEPSDVGENPFRVGYALDVLNLLAIIEEQSQDPAGHLRRADEDNIHVLGHSMGGGIALRVAVTRPDAVKALMLYASMNADEGKNLEKLLKWRGRYSELEAGVSAEILAQISPHNYFNRLTVPISIHHSEGDDVVPIAWSRELCATLTAREHPVECYFYGDIPHTFYGEADEALMARMIRFFREH